MRWKVLRVSSGSQRVWEGQLQGVRSLSLLSLRERPEDDPPEKGEGMKQLALIEKPEARAFVNRIKAPLKREYAEAVNNWYAAGRCDPFPYMLRPCEGLKVCEFDGSGKAVGVPWLTIAKAVMKSKYNMCRHYVIDGYVRASRLRVHDERAVLGGLREIYAGDDHEREE